jgi:hypothetical protein
LAWPILDTRGLAAGNPEKAIRDRLGEVMEPRAVSVEFGPSRSNRFPRALKLAREGASEFTDLGQGRYRAGFSLGDDPAPYQALGALVEQVRGWRATEVSFEEEPASAYHVKEMAWCAASQLGNYGMCRFRYVFGIMPRCSLCPLFDVERAIRDLLGENPPPSIDIEIRLGPNLVAALRREIPPGVKPEPPVEVPDFVPDKWMEVQEPLRRTPPLDQA